MIVTLLDPVGIPLAFKDFIQEPDIQILDLNFELLMGKYRKNLNLQPTTYYHYALPT